MKNNVWQVGDLIKYHRLNRKYGQADFCFGVISRIDPDNENEYRVHWFDDGQETIEYPEHEGYDNKENNIANISFLMRE